MRRSQPVPLDTLAQCTAEDVVSLPALEREHVQKVYDACAQEWHGTRYKAWPRVENFIDRLPAHSLIADLGCGNGKMAPASRASGHFSIGCDFSIELVKIAVKQNGLEAQAADVMGVPYRSGVFDAALSIAVLHHVSTEERRKLLVSETLRVLRPGGLALFYAWAAEQGEGRSGHVFEDSDVFVPFHSRLKPVKASAAASEDPGPPQKPSDGTMDAAAPAMSDGTPQRATLEAMGGVFDAAKKAVVFRRYCHVYREGELLQLLESVGGNRVVEAYYDTGNWCAVVQKQ